MGTKVTMSDIARALSVSTVTVSRALAGKEGVGEAMRESILQKAAELGYQSRPAPRNLLSGEAVGILLSCRFIGRDHTFYWEMYERVLESLGGYDAYGILEPVKVEDEEEAVPPRLLRNGRVRALLLIGRLSPRYLQALEAAGLPTVQLDDYFAGTRLDTVISDGYYGMYAMTDLLLRQGHRRIAYVGLVGATSSITDRYFGYCRALQERGIPVRPDWVIPDRKEHEKFPIPLPEEMPTAFVCNCDTVAYKLMGRLWERGLRVPEDISVVGFDGFAPSPLSPAVTTYAVDIGGMARAGVDALAERVADPQRAPVLRIVPGYVIEGESVGAI